MVVKKKFRVFDESIFDLHPDLKLVLKPNDHYPELDRILKSKFAYLPVGSFNTKVIINNGKVVHRVFKTPMGEIISLFSDPSKGIFDQVA